jgi:hypothetical protein
MKNSIESTTNSTTVPLSAGATFYGGAELNDFSHLGIQLKTDSKGVLFFDFSNDGTNWDSTFPTGGFQVSANIPEFHTAVKLGRYFRVRLINNGSDQTYLRLKLYYGNDFLPSASPLNQQIGIDHDAIMIRGTVPQDEIRIGRRSGVQGFTKFGHHENLQAGAGEQTIWDSTGNFVALISSAAFDIRYNSTTDGSDAAATGAKVLTFFYVDHNGNPAISAHALGNDGLDTTTFGGYGINRVAVSSSGSSQYNVNDISVSTEGWTANQAFVDATHSVTWQAIYFVGANALGVAKNLTFNINKVGGSAPKVIINGYVFNRNVQTRYLIYQYIMDTAVENHFIYYEPIGFNLSATDVLYFTADTDTNNTVINLRFSLNEYQNN